MKNPKILALVPAYNEENNIQQVVKEIKNCGHEIDVIVIDDCSLDKTKKVAKESGAIVLSLPFNLGIGGTVQTGFKYAHEYGYDIAIQIDGDCQHIPTEIGKLIDPILTNDCDVVIGSRYLNKTNYKTPLSRKIGILIFSFINTIVIRQKITDNTSGFRAYNRKAILFLSHVYPSDYPEVEAVVVLSKNHFRIMEVPVQMRERQHGNSSINSIKSFYYMIKVPLSILVNVFRKGEEDILNGQ